MQYHGPKLSMKWRQRWKQWQTWPLSHGLKTIKGRWIQPRASYRTGVCQLPTILSHWQLLKWNTTGRPNCFPCFAVFPCWHFVCLSQSVSLFAHINTFMHHYKGLFTWEAAVKGGWAAGGALGYVASRINPQNSFCAPMMRTCASHLQVHILGHDTARLPGLWLLCQIRNNVDNTSPWVLFFSLSYNVLRQTIRIKSNQFV